MSDEQKDCELKWMDEARMVFDQCWKKVKGGKVESETDKELREEIAKKISFWINIGNHYFHSSNLFRKFIDESFSHDH